jgi:hypothetical protein
METPQVDKAVQKCAEDIARAQAMIRAFNIVQRYLHEEHAFRQGCGPLQKQIDENFSFIHIKLYERLNKEWNHLTMMSPVHNKAACLAKKRAKSWFEKDNYCVREYMKEEGSMLVADADRFRSELDFLFGIRREENDKNQNV